jgi:hypothetical protein
MTQQEKDLLLKDLCARLPYDVKVEFNCIITSPAILKGIDKDFIECDIAVCELEDVKPYLFPMSSMTEEQKKEFNTKSFELQLKVIDDEIMHEKATEFEVDFYNKYHLDWRGLIPMGLAIDATGLNIY